MGVKAVVRKIIGAKQNETIEDALLRKKINVEKKFLRTKYSTEDLKEAIRTCGVREGDIVMVHCSWRSMYNYCGTPEDVISVLKDLVGTSGTILMPSYGVDRYFFDVDNTPSNAGVLSEVFRKQKDVKRSSCTHFSVAGWGVYVSDILCEHDQSEYGFDVYSPCYKLGEYDMGKILFLGLGSEPTKISVFHCAGAYLRDKDDKLKRLLSKEYESRLIIGGKEYKKKMYIRQPGHKNNKSAFKKIFKSLHRKKSVRISNLDIVLIDAEEAIQQAILFAKKGIYCYKRMKVL